LGYGSSWILMLHATDSTFFDSSLLAAGDPLAADALSVNFHHFYWAIPT